MTYGQLKFRLTKAFPSVDLDLIEFWISDRYAEILGELPWSRQNVDSVLITAAPYTTGAVAVTQGSTNVTLAGGTWTQEMNGRGFRTPPQGEFYEFTYVSSTSGSLDRPYEGATLTPPTLSADITSGALSATLDSTAGISSGQQFLLGSEVIGVTPVGNAVTITRGLLGTTAASHASGATLTPLSGYSIFQHIYPLPSDCRMLADDAFSSRFGPMQRFTHGELNRSDPQRVQSGTPCSWASYMDDNSTPPNMQVEIYPVPDKAIGIPFTYVADAAPLTQASAIVQVWMQPSALIEGVTARIKAHLKDYTGAPLHDGAAQRALKTMRSSEAQGMAPAALKLDSYYTSHRRRRGR